ncbi:MAG TPA: serine/threonine-protein kinase [Gemmatirosa sp.]
MRCDALLPELPPPAAAEPPDPETVALRRAAGGRYAVEGRLGGGGMATVYRARHALLDTPLALKVLHPHLARDPEMRTRFRREAESAARLQHPHVCPILDYATAGGVEGGVEFLVMPFFGGGSLADATGHGKRIAPEHAAAVAAQAAQGLDYAHRRGVVHRDVKPDNVLFDDEGYAVVTDFGIASARFHARMTATGRAMGTPHYMSPEQAMGRVLDGRSDVYALGVVLYEALAGAPPFDAPDPYQVGFKHVHEAPVPIEVAAPGVPPALAAIVMRTLAKNADERYQRAADLADALVAFLVERDAPELRVAWRARRPSTPPAPGAR